MAILNQSEIESIVEEINGDAEVSRRAKAARRHEIYKDGGKRFLLEQIEREFGKDAIKEMRIAPINLLKKIINKKSNVYKHGVVRTAVETSDQPLVDYYSQVLQVNQVMQKAHRYFNLFSNCVLYVVPYQGQLKLAVVPPTLYSIVPNAIDQTKPEAYVFNAFLESGRLTDNEDVPSASGSEGFSRNLATKTSPDYVASQEKPDDTENRLYVFWTKDQHFTVNGEAAVMAFDDESAAANYPNPIAMMPVINLAKDRDNETWATQGEDLVDLTIAIQSGWTDLLTIAKHQGFSILTVISEEEPKQLTVGVNRAVWLRRRAGEEAPSISYVQGNSPLGQYKDLLSDLLGLLLTTNDMNPNSISGAMASKSFTSGFHALIEQADTLEAAEEDKPKLKDAEKELWRVIGAWHNLMFDQNVLMPEVRSLGRFSDKVEVDIQYRMIKPIESEKERIEEVKMLIDLGLATKRDALKRLNPDMSEEQIDEKIEQLAMEQQQLMQLVAHETAETPEEEETETEDSEDESINED